MIRSRTGTTPSSTINHSRTSTTNNFDNLAFSTDNHNNDSYHHAHPPPSSQPPPRPYEHPPSYDTTMRNFASEAETRAANQYYAADRQSVRSKASNRSKRSAGRHRGGNQASSRSRRSGRGQGRDRDQGERSSRRDLPWVQITLSETGSVV